MVNYDCVVVLTSSTMCSVALVGPPFIAFLPYPQSLLSSLSCDPSTQLQWNCLLCFVSFVVALKENFTQEHCIYVVPAPPPPPPLLSN